MNQTDPNADRATSEQHGPEPSDQASKPSSPPSPPEQATAQSEDAARPAGSAETPGRADDGAASPGPASLDAMSSEVDRELEQAMQGADIDQLMADDQAQREAASKEQGAQSSPGKAKGDGPQQRFELDIRRGRIAAVTGEDVFVDIAGMEGKNQGIVPLIQFERAPRVGSIMEFVVEREDEAQGLVILSREGAVARATWDSMQRGVVVEGRVTGSNKGGLELELVGSIRAFMPASQIDLHRINDLEQFVGQKLTGTVQEVDRKGRNVVISRRQHLQQQREVAKRKLWDELEVGQLRDGVVTRLLPYGAFVDIGGMDGMVHISDMSYSHVDKPEQVLQVGQQVQVKVLKIEKDKDRISLGLKQASPDPWEGIEARYSVGSEVTGRVVRIADFGAFIEVETGVEGLLPISEISWSRVNKVTDQLKEGDVLRLKVLQVEAGKRRLSLSLKQSQGDPWVGAEHKFPVGAMVEAKVTSIVEFGAFVELEPGIEGMIHISELSEGRVGKVTDVVNVGDQKTLRVIQVDEEARRIKLSLKSEASQQSQQQAAADAQKEAGKHSARKKIPKGNLKGGMDKHGGLGIGLGDLKL